MGILLGFVVDLACLTVLWVVQVIVITGGLPWIIPHKYNVPPPVCSHPFSLVFGSIPSAPPSILTAKSIHTLIRS